MQTTRERRPPARYSADPEPKLVKAPDTNMFACAAAHMATASDATAGKAQGKRAREHSPGSGVASVVQTRAVRASACGEWFVVVILCDCSSMAWGVDRCRGTVTEPGAALAVDSLTDLSPRNLLLTTPLRTSQRLARPRAAMPTEIKRKILWAYTRMRGGKTTAQSYRRVQQQ